MAVAAALLHRHPPASRRLPRGVERALLRPIPEALLNPGNDTAQLTVNAANGAADIPLLDWIGIAILMAGLAAVAALRLR